MRKLQFRILRDRTEAMQAWEALSPHRTLDDEWDFRYTFTKYLHYSLHFIAGYDNGELVGLLPLQYNASYGLQPPYAPRVSGFLEFFGGDDMDSNDIFLKPGYEMYREDFFHCIDRPAVLAPLHEDFAEKAYVTPYTYKYFLPLHGYRDYESFLQDRVSSGTRQNMRRQIRQLYAHAVIDVNEGSKDDLDLLISLSLKRFGRTSSFRYEYRKHIFRDLFDLFDSSVITISVNGTVEAVAFTIFHKAVFSDINAIANPDIPNLGKLLSLILINKAIEKGASVLDAGKGDSGWKEQFHLQRIPQYQLDIRNFFSTQHRQIVY